MAELEFTFDVVPTPEIGGEPFRLVAKSRVLGQWEREFRGRSLAGLDKIKVNDIEEIAYVAAKRDRGYTGNLADFRDTHDVDILSPKALAREKARIRAMEDRRELGQEWTEQDTERFDRAFDKEWDSDADDDHDTGGGPTRLAR